MKIAVGSDDKKTIRKGHFGESRFYLVFEVLNGEMKTEELRENPRNLEQNHHGEAHDIVELLSDCGIFMGRSMGKKSMMKIAEKNIDCIITTTEEIDQAVAKFLEGKDEGYQFFDTASSSLLPCSMRWTK
ncbi:dinitrogenase iron-molybdenum cofactor [bacterium BMS3Abin05]|nr:dinitrogenase iron-molybdenum cofactor [bacterium BMS3Abin05]GBE26630.1 dinitrogenase iron-molybdenum cofactor [bacterium BMS3Bbin03]HDZ11372.1 dinitrogenase iron-molybdenum cofactor biosynthesis protein [Bacteroidota bacterium]